MASNIRAPPLRARKVQSQLFERHVTKSQMTQLLKESLIEFQQKDKPELLEARFKGRHIFVGDKIGETWTLF